MVGQSTSRTIVNGRGDKMVENLRNARVHSYTRIPYLVVYIIVLIGLFVWDLNLKSHLSFTQRTDSNWFRFDIPWVCMVIVVWIFTLQRMSYRKKIVNLYLDKINSVCIIEGGAFAGEWRLHKKSPRSMASMKPLTIIGLVLTVFIIVVNLMNLYHSRYVMMKVNAVQGLFEAILLLGIFVPFLSFWRYPYQVVLRQKDKLLSLQCQD